MQGQSLVCGLKEGHSLAIIHFSCAHRKNTGYYICLYEIILAHIGDIDDYFTLFFFLSCQIFVDKAAKRAVLSLGVKCANWKRKCDWTGDLIYVEVRLENI